MDLSNLYSSLSGVLMAFAFVPYIRAIWTTRHLSHGAPGRVEPRKSSWILWGTLDAIIFAGMLKKHVFNWQIMTAVICAWSVAVLAMKYGERGWKLIDKMCMVLAVLTLVVGHVLHDPRIWVGGGALALVISSVPTFVSAWENPAHEDKTAWIIFEISCVYELLALPNWRLWTLETASQPVAFFIIDTIVLAVIFFRKVPQRVAFEINDRGIVET